MADVHMSDNSQQIIELLKARTEKALNECGHVCEGWAMELCPVKTGTLRRSISHAVAGDTVYIGTNVEYAPYVEFGTGAANVAGGTVEDSWVYRDEWGNFHRAHPQPARPFLKPSVADHVDAIKTLIENVLDGKM